MHLSTGDAVGDSRNLFSVTTWAIRPCEDATHAAHSCRLHCGCSLELVVLLAVLRSGCFLPALDVVLGGDHGKYTFSSLHILITCCWVVHSSVSAQASETSRTAEKNYLAEDSMPLIQLCWGPTPCGSFLGNDVFLQESHDMRPGIRNLCGSSDV